MRRPLAAPLRALARLVPLTALVGLMMLAVACAQAPATTDVGEDDLESDDVDISAETPAATPTGPVLDTISVWLREHGILLWTPAVEAAGTYAFEIENLGEQPHDVVVVRAPKIEAIPTRSGRALLEGVEVVARSPVLSSEETTTLLVDLDKPGSYVVLSTQQQDFGAGMASIVAVGSTALSGVAPIPPPEETTPAAGGPEDSETEGGETVAAYLVDHAVFLADRQVSAGIVTFEVQNIGPSPHDLVVVQWRGAPDALPVDDEGALLLDGLMVVNHLPALDAGETATLEVELEHDFAYVVLSSLPGDYEAGMRAQVVPR